VRALEERVEDAVEAGRQARGRRAGGRDERAGVGGQPVGAVGAVDDEALADERVEQVVGRGRALAQPRGDRVGAQAGLGLGQVREQPQDGACGADATGSCAGDSGWTVRGDAGLLSPTRPTGATRS
jgi:hypothetical protein